MIEDTYVYLIPRRVKSEEKIQENLLVTTVRTPSNVYILENEEQCYMSQIDEILLWNRRMGHLNFDNIVRISKKRVVRNLPKIIKPPNHVCIHCLHGKQTRTSFKVKEHTTSHPL